MRAEQKKYFNFLKSQLLLHLKQEQQNTKF